MSSIQSVTIPSIYLPHVHATDSKEFVLEVLENKFKLGVISKIECIPKINQTDGHEYYSCFVFFESWGTGENASYVLSRLLCNEQTKIKYSGDKYWVICMNQSVVAFYKDPVHMDLITYLHTDFTTDTVLSVMNGLDLGKIDSVEFIRGSDANYFGENIIWDKANKSIWDREVPYIYNSVIVRFSFWYRTQTSYAFQYELNQNGYIDIPVSDGLCWTFYSQTPLLDGVNPNVLYKKPKHIRFDN
jgi:hypothetical protein